VDCRLAATRLARANRRYASGSPVWFQQVASAACTPASLSRHLRSARQRGSRRAKYRHASARVLAGLTSFPTAPLHCREPLRGRYRYVPTDENWRDRQENTSNASQQKMSNQQQTNNIMIPIHPHLIGSSMLALPAAVALTRKLIHDHKSSLPVIAGSPADRMNQVERRAKTLTETLKNIVGYPHHGLNE